MQEKYVKYYSHILNKDIEILISGHWGQPVLMFPTSMGGFNQNKDFGLIDSVGDLIEAGNIKTFNVETIDNQSFYDDNISAETKVYNYELYTTFLKNELVPAIQKECGVHRIIVAGCSFGGYHSTNFAFKYPDLVSGLISMSGAFSIKNFVGGFYNDNVYFNDPLDYMANAESWRYNHMKIILGTSDWDSCKGSNLAMSALLGSKGIDHWYDEKRWADHDWPLWKMTFPEYIRKVIF
jgi:esterase/lipase superfamily enzyme